MMMQPAHDFKIGDFVGYVDGEKKEPVGSPEMPEWRVAEVGRLSACDAPGLALARLGFESYRPVITEKRRCGPRGKLRRFRRPLLGPYLFVNVAAADIRHACAAHLGGTVALRGFLTINGDPKAVPPAEIDRLRLRCAEGDFDEVAGRTARPSFSPGDQARVLTGPFCDFAAVIDSVMGENARVMIDLFGRATPAEMPLMALEHAG